MNLRPLAVLALGIAAPALCLSHATPAATRVTHLLCEDMKNPLGIDALRPQLSWQMSTSRRGARQTDYEILVATQPSRLPQHDVWDSGKIDSDQSVHVPYAGPALRSGQRYYWQVRVWDEAGRASAPSETAWWETGLLSPSDWKASWIAHDTPGDRDDRASGVKWIWTADEPALTHPAAGEHQFRFHFSLNAKPVQATLFITAEDKLLAWANCEALATTNDAPWGTFQVLDVTHQLRSGNNLLAAQASADSSASAGLIALLRVRLPDGHVLRFVSGPQWKSARNQTGKWFSQDFDDTGWQPAADVANVGQQPLGTPWPPAPASYLRRNFRIEKQVRSARLYATALGSYELHLNGQRVDDQVLAPGWTDYRTRLLYQTYDVTSLLHRGENALGALLGDGWYASGLVFYQQRFNFGAPPLRMMAQLNIEYTDGSTQVIATDGSWKAAASPIRSSDLYNGEEYDARLEVPGWDRADFHDDGWDSVTVEPAYAGKLEAQDFQPIRPEMVLPAKAVTHPAPGVYLFDLGQNMVGWARLRVKGPRGTTVRLRFGEVLDANGEFYNANMRSAKETDTYTLRGNGDEIFEPHFTYHGFRYVEVTGYPGTPPKDAIEGVVFHTAAPLTMHLHTGSAMVNQLWSNIEWSQRGNFLSVPTDCPQRDERLGWMGDAQVFWRTAAYNMNLAAFSRKFSEDARIAQAPDGQYWDISPRVEDIAGSGNPGWADAGIVIPWTAYVQYGDRSILAQNWDAMTKWLDYLEAHNPAYVRHMNATYGDWLSIGSTTPYDLIATAFWAYDTTLMAQMADALGKPAEAARYRALFEKIQSAFTQAFVHSDGTIGSGSQTGYVLALHMNLLSEKLRKSAADHLVTDIAAHDGHLTTGFLGTPYLMLELSRSGHSETAYQLLLNKTFPSWGYMIDHGATTMWERWNGNQKLDDPSMNSFNHYAYGAVGEWLYRYAAGIDTTTGGAGFHQITLHPQFNPALRSVSATYDSPYGAIVSAWTDDGHTITWKVTIPPNATGQLDFPAGYTRPILDGKPIAATNENGATYEAVPGTYTFTLMHAQ